MIDRFHKGRAFTMTHELKTKLPLTVNLSFEYEISGIDLEQSRQFANRVSSQIYEVNIHEQDHHTSLYLEKLFHNILENNERSDNKF